MSTYRAFVILACLPHGAAALTCQGEDPAWSLTLGDHSATFTFLDRASDMTIPQMSTPDGQDWPRAMTLIAPRDSAIVILEAPADPQPIRILTQRGETPILLVGTCEDDA
ncbi:hypothetical protein AB3Y40_07155 [Yoonia sp. R2331]|uniref:hypothetical protein n=1 Tax=Yoonia sp. R2331 TaxID=3237238 RepID=UPI0034E54214